MRNVTLRLPDDLLRQAKIVGVNRESSLSELMRQALEDLIRRSDGYEVARRFALAAMATGFDSGVETARYPWPRDEVHDRD
jgi:predicted transcriptional regulator